MEGQYNAVYASVEDHAGCAGFHRAHSKLESEKESTAIFYATAARNVEIAATEIAASEVQKDLAVEMVDEIAETHAAEWAYAIESKTRPEAVLAQAVKCQTMAQEQKTAVGDLLKAKYGFKK